MKGKLKMINADELTTEELQELKNLAGEFETFKEGQQNLFIIINKLADNADEVEYLCSVGNYELIAEYSRYLLDKCNTL